MKSDRIDRAIDEVARQLTEGEAPGALRARVMARLDEPRGSMWRSPRVLVPIAAAAAIAIAIAGVIVVRDRRPNISPITPTIETARRVDPPNATPPPTTSMTTTTTATTTAAVRLKADTTSLMTPPSITALAPLASLDVAGIAVDAIAPADALRIPQLETIAPIAVDPLAEPEGDRP